MEKMNYYYYYYHYNYCYILLTKFETLPLPSPKAATCIQYRVFLKVLTVKCLKLAGLAVSGKVIKEMHSVGFK